MMSTMPLGKGASVGRKQGYEGEYDEYYGGEWGEWEEEEYGGEAGMSMGYYGDSWNEDSAGWDIFEVDLYSMVLTLDESLNPQDIYLGFEFNEKSFLMVLDADDIEDASPAAWKSRPLKIHPEPAPRTDKKPEISRAFSGMLDADASGLPSGATTPTKNSGPPTSIGSPAQLLGLAQSQGSTNASQEVAAAPNLPRLPDIGTPQHKQNGSDVLGGGADLLQGLGSPGLSPRTPGQQGANSVAASPGGQSPKIFLSDDQLETLKAKMQALKQRRTVTPMQLPPAVEEDGAANETNSREENGQSAPVGSVDAARPSQPIVHSNCPQKHGLKLFKTPDPGWWCSVCQREHSKGAPFYGCRKCDYDECEACALKSRTTPVSPKASPRVSPRASPRKPSPVQPPAPVSPDPSPVGDVSASPSPPIRRLSPNEKVKKQVKKRTSIAQAQARRENSTPASDDDEDDAQDEPEEETRPKTKHSRRHKARSRRATATPEHWEPKETAKEKHRSPQREVPLRRRRDSTREDRKEATSKRRQAAAKRQVTRSPSSRKDPSSSDEPLPKKRVAKRPTSSASEDPPPRGKAPAAFVSLNARNKAAASPEAASGRSTKASNSPEPSRLARRAIADTATRRQGGGGDDLLRRVLGANRAGKGSARRAEIAEAPTPPSKGVSKPTATRAPQNIRRALEDFASQIDRKSRRV